MTKRKQSYYHLLLIKVVGEIFSGYRSDDSDCPPAGICCRVAPALGPGIALSVDFIDQMC